ncbi:hypothetical protein ASPACDRAFT_38856 [Aspergillus aculeatus ATCC 16872]|uniref:Major facilitator superfamily (MFS) profile domain-containing protein n=1 Tax=Aspergillus aculeatus (strain ATCC 16872 / CBS 172.66 / WB 5094) TaxID=690307 RepID=A0A1L9XA22_ASPA1|nr:uncharacterized protein ASPACDRAFT_38856 [Aspergillus aculeatus ATCC 16872]OJK05285.1 hypothetical protein ASPACDRAFT_38856 [Aspergillus aculeatus ATCC 16872]
MSSSERIGLLASSGNGRDPTGPNSTDSPKDKSSGTNSSTRLAIFIAYVGMPLFLLGSFTIANNTRAFLASSDESVVIATYDVIASEFHELAKGPWLVTGYNLGYCIALPIGVCWSVATHCALFGSVPRILPRPPRRAAEPQTSNGGNIKQLGYLGIATYATAVVALLMAITIAGQEGGKMSHIDFWLVIFTTCSNLLILHEILWTKRPLVPLKLATKGIDQYWLVELLIFSGRYGLVATITQYPTQVKRLSEATAPMYLVLCTMGLAVGSMASGFAIQRILSSVLLFFSWHFDHPVAESLLVIPMSTPIGIITAGDFIDMSSRAPPEVLASSIGAYLSQQLGLIVGAAMGPLVVRTGFKHDIAGRLNESVENEVIRNVLRDAKYVDTLPEDNQRVVRSSLGCGYQFVPVLATVTVALCVPSLVWTREQSVE